MPNWQDAPELEDWIVGEYIGGGDMGVVYRATQREGGEDRAVKLMRPEIVDALPLAARIFAREMRISEALLHQHIVRTYACRTVGERSYIVMELCARGSLAHLVRTGGALSAADAVPIFLGLLDGLAYAHNAPIAVRTADGSLLEADGVVHRDIKPENILMCLGPEGETVAKIADFGMSKAYEVAGLSNETISGMIGGTPGFMPRWQVLDFKYAGPEVDVWAVAATLYFALTAATPRDFSLGQDAWLVISCEACVPIAQRGRPIPAPLGELLDQVLQADSTNAPAFTEAAKFRDALAAIPLM